MPALELVMFDLDGTLVDTAPDIADAVNDTLRQFNWPEIDVQQVALWIGHGTRALLQQAVARATDSTPEALQDSEILAAVEAAYGQRYAARCGARSRVYPQVRETLARLRQHGTRLAIVTNKEKRYTDRVLAAHDLRRAVDDVICGDTLDSRKPDPAVVLACLRNFGVSRERALFVGDSSVDVATARNAGVAVWLLTNGYNQGQAAAQAHPDRVIVDLSDLLACTEGAT